MYRVIVKKLINETIELDTEKTKNQSSNYSIKNNSQKKKTIKENEVINLTNSALQKYNNGDLDGAIEDSNKAISIDKSISNDERTAIINDQMYANRGFYLAKKQEFDKAIKDYNTAIEINSKIFLHNYLKC